MNFRDFKARRQGLIVLFGVVFLSVASWSPGQESLILSVFAKESAMPIRAQDIQAKKGVGQLWNEVKISLKKGAYRNALSLLERIASRSPNDPKVRLYRSLCERRLSAEYPFVPISAVKLRALRDRLKRETRSRKRSAAKRRAMDRQLRKEQKKWDQDIEAQNRKAEETRKRAERKARKAAAEEARMRRRRQRTRVRAERRKPFLQKPESPGAPLPSKGLPASMPSKKPVSPKVAEKLPAHKAPSRTAETIPAGAEKSLELPAVVVTTEPTGPRALTPSLEGQEGPPPGAVQINADQMSVAPERNMAFAEGNVEVIYGDALLTCDKMTLFTDTHDVYAEGHVRLERGNQVSRGDIVHYNFDTKKGRFLQGTVFSAPWYEHGRSVTYIAEGVYKADTGYVTSCDQDPPHYRFIGGSTTVFAKDKLARVHPVALYAQGLPLFYMPWLMVADRQSPFFIIPGKRKPWGHYALMGYRYELPGVLGDDVEQKGTVRLDWRRYFGWGVGLDHQIESPRLGKGLLKIYYNDLKNRQEPDSALPKGADEKRYRLLWRHLWRPRPDTTVITDLQDFSDENFRKDFLFREEFVEDDVSESIISAVISKSNYSLSGLVKKRMNRFQTVDELLPQLTLDVRQREIGDTNIFAEGTLDFANFQTKRRHSGNDTDVIRLDWFQKLSYALNWFRPILITPNVGVRQTYYTKDMQGGPERPQGKRDIISGQLSMGTDASLKLFRIFPIKTNVMGLDINWLRHVLTPTISYSYVRQPTVTSDQLTFAAAESPTNSITFGIENKLQTKRWIGQRPRKQLTNRKEVDGDATGKENLGKSGGANEALRRQMTSVDLARFLISVPYTFRGASNKAGGRLGDWSFDLELYPWPWMRLESDWSYPSHFVKGSRDSRVTAWNTDLVIVGGAGAPQAQSVPGIQAPSERAFESGPRGALTQLLMPEGQWYLGLGHRFSHNDKTETVVQYDRRLSKKWEISTFHRLTWKEVASGSKRFNNLREYQYVLRRDLHDWIAEFVYRVDREFGEELWLTLTLKAYPMLPVELATSYHEPKLGSQSSPFSPLAK